MRLRIKVLALALTFGGLSLVSSPSVEAAFTVYQSGAKACTYKHADAVTGSQNLASKVWTEMISYSNSTVVRKVYHPNGPPGGNVWHTRGIKDVGTFSYSGSYAYCYN